MSVFSHVQGDWLGIDDARIWYEQAGNASGPAVLFLHGGMGHLGDFSVLATSLAATHRLIGLDTRGHGKSTLGSRALTYQQIAEDALCLLDHLRIECASLIGFSDGGIVGYRLALQAPDRIDRLVAIGAPCSLSDQAAQILERITPAACDARFPHVRVEYERLNPEADFARFIEASKQLWLDRSATGYPNPEAIQDIRQPTLIVRGDDDHLFSLDEAVALRRQLPQAQLLNVPSAGHLAFQDQHEICALAIRDFLRPRG